MRIVSLLPSATEIICALGAHQGNICTLVGISHSCDYPAEICDLDVLTSTRVPVHETQLVIDQFVRQEMAAGRGLYALDIEKLAELRADVIVTQTLCDVCAVSSGDVYQAVADLPGDCKLVELAPSCLDDVYDDIIRVGDAVYAGSEARQLVMQLRERAEAVSRQQILNGDKVLFLEWLDPPFSGGHWIPDLIDILGGTSCLVKAGQRSGTLSWQAITECDPDIIVVGCCGYSLEESEAALHLLADHAPWLSLRAVREGNVIVGDGNAHFSRAGPRLIDGLEELAANLLAARSTLPGA
ncbi:ABC transporter substrate-binding protein [Pseudohongiella sp.]|uniref:Fe/B12 periplasmic-binding domain-containing protein n=1 Tax=marine sediment metagenome TaxID=412755 RepID=A0A0F9VVC9_9ZZZZ|nr:ABC transporter substrate-binding protein [Pseudohongiella sp.]HDZ07974.1 cobalamin-binding protein [Pseudohongiella sp.]HEA64419.1 cobalamin-binding protein [Pseudohongiella sp.]